MSAPARDILLVSLGTTPQVVTETLWHLFRRKPPFVPAEIHLLTTRLGEAAIRPGGSGAHLCDPDAEGRIEEGRGGRLVEFRESFGVPLPQVFIRTSEPPPEDLRSEGTTLDYADLCIRVIAELRRRPHPVRLHASLAGGRKSMSFYMGYALSLLGDPGDELSHVLVAPADFESHPDFWWPGGPPGSLVTRDGRRLSTAEARVDLVSVPFLALRDHVEPELLADLAAGRKGFSDLVRRIGERVAPELRLGPERGETAFGGMRLRLPPLEYALLHVLARAWKERWPGVGPDGPGGRGWLGWQQFTEPGEAVATFLDVYGGLAAEPQESAVVAVMERLRAGAAEPFGRLHEINRRD